MRKLDNWLGVAFALLGGWLAVAIVFQSGRLFFYQNFSPEVVYFACGFGMHHPGTVPDKLLDFLLLRTTAFDCADLGTPASLNPPGWFMQIQGYLSWSAALIWRFTSIRYTSLWPLPALLCGAYSAGCYALLRQLVRRRLAVPGALVLTLSPLALSMAIMVRDYSKAPFFIWALVFAIQALRARDWKAILGWSAAGGLMIGAGYGFRGDIMMLLPLLVITFLFAPSFRLLPLRALGAAVLVAVTLATAAPILKSDKDGVYGSVIIQGMSDPFRSFLGMTPAPYSFGNRYSDELVLSSIAADERPDVPDWDAHEGPEVYDVSQALKLSGKNWQGFFPLFAADFVAQAFKSATWIAGMPALVAPDHAPDPAFKPGEGRKWSAVFSPVYRWFTVSWLPLLGIAGLFVQLARLWSKSRMEALGLAFLFGTMMTYPVVQFSIRHVFHLEFLWVLGVLSLVELPMHWRETAKGLRSFAALLLAGALAGSAGYWVLLRYQQAKLGEAFEALLSLPRQQIGTLEGSANPPMPAALTIPVPQAYESLIHAAPDSMTPRIRGVGIQWDVRSAADRLLVTLSGSACSDQISVTANYDKGPEIWQPMDQTFTLDPGKPVDGTRLLLPAFYRPTQHLSGLTFSGLPIGCSALVERIEGRTALPALLTARLPKDWKVMPLYSGFGGL